MKKESLLTLLSIGFLITAAACSSDSSSSGTDTVTLATIDALPQASAPVVDSTSGSLSAAVKAADSDAETGLILQNISSDDFSQSSSLALCNSANMLRSALNEAVQGDVILCYIQAMAAQDGFTAQVGDIDIYDGEPHIFNMDFSEEGGGGAFRVKIQITKDSAGTITAFNMWACDGASQDSLAQSEYLSQAIDGASWTMNSTFSFEDENGSGSHEMNAEGTLNTSGEFTAKTITSSYTGNWGDGTNYGTTIVEQGADTATITSSDTGTYTWSNGGNSSEQEYGNQVFAEMALLDTELMATFAVGHGAAKGINSGTYGQLQGDTVVSVDYDETFTQGWNGDTTAVDEDSTFLDAVTDATLPDEATEPTITFSGDEVYDCSGTGAVNLTVDGTAIDAACSDLTLGWNWVSCYDIIQNGNVQE